jgi:hypothetical protein
MKTMKATSLEDLKQMYDVDVEDGNLVVDDPQDVVHALFGSGVSVNDVSTAEKVIELISTRFPKPQQRKIFKFASQRAAPLKMKKPKEIQ